MSARTSQAGHRRFLQPPRSSSGGGCLSPHGLPGGPERCNPGRRARLPRQGAYTGGSRLWFPSLRLVFQKGDLTAEILMGAGGFEPPGSLVRQNTAPITPSSAR
jgi:hypothetical protein